MFIACFSDPTKTSRVKQADVVLIGYPLNLETNQETRKNDLELYEKVTTTNGPAMTWSIFCVGHLELGQTDKADELFKRQLLQANKPFQVSAMSMTWYLIITLVYHIVVMQSFTQVKEF